MKSIKWNYEYEDERYSGEYEVREWSWGERLATTESATKIRDMKKLAAGDSSGFAMSTVELELQKMLTCLIKAPFEIKREVCLELPDAVAQDILLEINKLNGLKKKTKKTYTE